jgi:hypothetical protein
MYVTLMPDSSQTNTVFTFRTSNANTIGRTKVKMVTEHFDGADNLGPIHHTFFTFVQCAITTFTGR